MDTLVTRENTNKLYKSSKWPNVLQWLKHYSGQITTLIKHYENQAASYLLLRNRCLLTLILMIIYYGYGNCDFGESFMSSVC